MRSLIVLQRLAKQAVDRERQALLAIQRDIAEVESQIETWQQSIQRETSTDLDFMTSGATLTAFVGSAKTHLLVLQERLAQLQDGHAAQMERVREERVSQKRYELLAERRARQAALDAAMKEQKKIEEILTMRSGRCGQSSP